MENHSGTDTKVQWEQSEIAELPENCIEKLRMFERELNKQGYWNIALVAYQQKG